MSANGASATPNPAIGSGTTVSGKKSDKDVDLGNAARGVWLVKVPKYIADRWEDPSCEASEVGKLKIVRAGAGKPAVSFSLDDSILGARKRSSTEDKEDPDSPAAVAAKQEIPKEHKFMVNSVQSQTLAVFSVTQSDPEALLPTPDKLSVEGKVVQRAECRPISDSVYMRLKKDSIVQAIVPKRQTMHTDHVNAYKPIANHASNIANEKMKKAQGKMLRDDKNKVMEALFALFEKHQYYNIKDLVKETRQPVTYLKEILKEVCDYNMKNPHKNMWELKPEYRHYHAEKPEGGDGDDAAKAEEKNSDDSDDDME